MLPKQIGVPNPKILTGKDSNNMLPEALVVQAAQTDIFAEVEPFRKNRSLKLCKNQN